MIHKWSNYSKKIFFNYSGIEGSKGSSCSSLIEGRDSNIFLLDPTEAVIVRTTLITINNVAVIAVNLESKFADPLADIIPPKVPPPSFNRFVPLT